MHRADTSKRTSWLVLLLLGFLGLGCTEAEDSLGPDDDVDGVGKGDGISSASADRLFDAPFYFSVPKGVITTTVDRAAYPYPTLWNKSLETGEVGLRVIAIRQEAGVVAHRAARREMARTLAAAGVLKDGDIVLTFRPELAGTMPYPHIQMGSTHAGLVYTGNGEAFNIDSPLDSQYVGQFDSAHYAGDGATDAGTDALHVLRPRGFDEARRARLRQWVGTLKANLPRINGQRAQVKFQSDYLTPIYVSEGATTRQTVTTLGKIILEADTTSTLPMFCSEFAWHMLALSGCTAEEIRAAPASGADCVAEVFSPLPLVARNRDELGLAEGPLLALLGLPVEARQRLVDRVFATGDAAKLSSGHRRVAEEVAPLMGPLSRLYGARAAGASVEDTAAAAGQLDANFPANYSPTSFLVETLDEDASRAVDYVATVVFVDSANYDKARQLARAPVP